MTTSYCCLPLKNFREQILYLTKQSNQIEKNWEANWVCFRHADWYCYFITDWSTRPFAIRSVNIYICVVSSRSQTHEGKQKPPSAIVVHLHNWRAAAGLFLNVWDSSRCHEWEEIANHSSTNTHSHVYLMLSCSRRALLSPWGLRSALASRRMCISPAAPAVTPAPGDPLFTIRRLSSRPASAAKHHPETTDSLQHDACLALRKDCWSHGSRLWKIYLFAFSSAVQLHDILTVHTILYLWFYWQFLN